MNPRTVLVISLGVLLAHCNEGPATRGDSSQQPARDTAAPPEVHRSDALRDPWQRPDSVLARLGNLNGRTVADIGAGTGYFALKLAAAGAERVIAVEVDPQVVQELNRRVFLAGQDHVEVRFAEYHNPYLKTNEATDALLVNVYPEIERRVDYLKLVRNGLQSGGRLWVIDFLPGDLPPPVGQPKRLPHTQVAHELAAAGFDVVAVDTTLLPYQYLLEARR